MKEANNAAIWQAYFNCAGVPGREVVGAGGSVLGLRLVQNAGQGCIMLSCTG